MESIQSRKLLSDVRAAMGRNGDLEMTPVLSYHKRYTSGDSTHRLPCKAADKAGPIGPSRRRPLMDDSDFIHT